MTTTRVGPAFHFSKGTGGVSTIGVAPLQQIDPEPNKVTRDDQTVRRRNLIHQPPGGSSTADATARFPQPVDKQNMALRRTVLRKSRGNPCAFGICHEI